MHITSISQEIPQPSITKICLKITYLKFHLNLPGANELNAMMPHMSPRQWQYNPEQRYNKMSDDHAPQNNEPVKISSWWRHQMEKLSALLAICAGNAPVIGEFHAQRPVRRSFDVFFDLRLNKRLNNREAGDLRRHRAHYDVIVMLGYGLVYRIHQRLLIEISKTERQRL